MADVNIVPRISCDNCGSTEDKRLKFNSRDYEKPGNWGSCKIEGSRSVDSYGGKDRVVFIDLCPKCAQAAADAASVALKKTRGEA